MNKKSTAKKASPKKKEVIKKPTVEPTPNIVVEPIAEPAIEVEPAAEPKSPVKALEEKPKVDRAFINPFIK